MQTSRSAVLIGGRIYLQEIRPLDHQSATLFAGDYKANEGYDAKVIRLPRRIFKGRFAQHHIWQLAHGAQPSWVL